MPASDDIIANQARGLPLLTTPANTSGRTYIVTGANTGLGFEAAKHLAVLGAAKVILAVRNPTTGAAAKAQIDEAAGLTDNAGSAVVEVWPLDLCSFDSVKAFVARADKELERIDGVIENAAVALTERELAEGHVKPVTVNVLSTFLMAAKLVPVMSRKAKGVERCEPRLVLVTSRIGFDYEEMWKGIGGDPVKAMDSEEVEVWQTYGLSKLTETLAGREFARLLPVEKTGVVVDLVCPGLCVTSLGRHASEEAAEFMRNLHAQYGRTAEDGSRTLLHGVVAGPESHGHLLHSCEDGEKDIPDWANNKEMEKHTWEVIARHLEVAEPGVVSKMVQCA